MAERLVSVVERLGSSPRSGRMVPEFEDDRLREVIRASYRIVYQVLDDTVEVLTVYHAARSLADPRRR